MLTAISNDERGSGRVAFAPAPVCGQCKFLDIHRKTCEGKLELLEGDRSFAVRPKAEANNPACGDRFIEIVPF